jgi:hypothetical protein
MPGDDSRVRRGSVEPVRSVDDPRVVSMLAAEHSSLLTARSLAYNEAFTRGGMFLAFLSTSFVALALIAQALPLDRGFLAVAAIVLIFDLVVGVTTYGRIILANYEDYRAVRGIARIRHGYADIAPLLRPYFVDSTHDDLTGVMVAYGSPPTRGAGAVVYQLTTSSSLILIIVAMLGAVLGFVAGLLAGANIEAAIGAALLAGGLTFVILVAGTIRYYLGLQARFEVAFPTPPGETGRR